MYFISQIKQTKQLSGDWLYMPDILHNFTYPLIGGHR